MSKHRCMVIRQLYLVTMQTASIMGCHYTEKYIQASLQCWGENKCKPLSKLQNHFFQHVCVVLKCKMFFLKGFPHGYWCIQSSIFNFFPLFSCLFFLFKLFPPTIHEVNTSNKTHGQIPYALCNYFVCNVRKIFSQRPSFINQNFFKSLIYLETIASGKQTEWGNWNQR